MPYLKNYLDKIIERGNVGLAESISNTAETVGNNYLKISPSLVTKLVYCLAMYSLAKQDRCLE